MDTSIPIVKTQIRKSLLTVKTYNFVKGTHSWKDAKCNFFILLGVAIIQIMMGIFGFWQVYVGGGFVRFHHYWFAYDYSHLNIMLGASEYVIEIALGLTLLIPLIARPSIFMLQHWINMNIFLVFISVVTAAWAGATEYPNAYYTINAVGLTCLHVMQIAAGDMYCAKVTANNRYKKITITETTDLRGLRCWGRVSTIIIE